MNDQKNKHLTVINYTADMNKVEIFKQLKKYQEADTNKSTFIFLTTFLISCFSIGIAVFSYDSYPILSFMTLPVSFVYLCRSFILIHDAGHGALFPNRSMNVIVGNLMGFINMMPFDFWKYIHNMHHSTHGKLHSREDNPELMTWTVDEFKDASILRKSIYISARSVFTQVFLVPFVIFIFTKIPVLKHSWKANTTVIIHDIFYALIVYYAIKNDIWVELLLFYLVPLFLVHVYASLIFYLQHQFDGTLWQSNDEWSMFEVSVEGSSYLRFNPVFNWVTGSIGFHHIHHLNPRIPFYNLKGTHEGLSAELNYSVVYFRDFFKHIKCKLWDEKKKRLVSFKEINNS